jgi:hypothetical protein
MMPPRRLGEGVVKAAVEDASEVPFGPKEGDFIEKNGITYRFAKVASGAMVWDPELNQRVQHYHTLNTWFSHFTKDIGPGPGWDSRMGLANLAPEEMMQRFGHVFTSDEIFSVSDIPDDIPYLILEPIDEDDE